jgi:uncharacterized DUF497 family protein
MSIDLSIFEDFDWDKANVEHIKKHDVETKECEDVFENKPLIINDDTKHSHIEKRFRVFGQTKKKRLLTIIFTIRSKMIRIISARDQNKKERTEFRQIGGEDLSKN